MSIPTPSDSSQSRDTPSRGDSDASPLDVVVRALSKLDDAQRRLVNEQANVTAARDVVEAELLKLGKYVEYHDMPTPIDLVREIYWHQPTVRVKAISDSFPTTWSYQSLVSRDMGEGSRQRKCVVCDALFEYPVSVRSWSGSKPITCSRECSVAYNLDAEEKDRMRREREAWEFRSAIANGNYVISKQTTSIGGKEIVYEYAIILTTTGAGYSYSPDDFEKEFGHLA